MTSTKSPVRSDLEEIVGKQAGGGASPSPSPSPAQRANKSFAAVAVVAAAAVEMKQIGSKSADQGSVFKMATFAESGTEYAKVTKPVVEYK